MIYLWIALLVVGYTVAAVVTVDVIDATDHANTLENFDRMILGAAWPVVVICLPALLIHRLFKWVEHRHQVARLTRRLVASEKASAEAEAAAAEAANQ